MPTAQAHVSAISSAARSRSTSRVSSPIQSTSNTPPTVPGSGGRRGLGQREQHREPGVARPRRHPQVAAVSLDDDPVGDVEAEAGALPHGLGGEERLEDPGPEAGGGAPARGGGPPQPPRP